MLNSGYFYLGVIYLVWGTTYLAMRLGVGPASGFPVFGFGAVRCLAAAGLLLLLAAVRAQRLRLDRPEAFRLAFTGLSMWLGAHGLVLIAEKTVGSGLAAITVSTSPLWVLILGGVWERRLPDPRHLAFVAAGLAGIGLLAFPEFSRPAGSSLPAFGLLLVAPVVWAYCALYLQRQKWRLSILAVSGYQHLFGGMGFLALALVSREPRPAPTVAAWAALGFLVVFGSVIAYTSYLKALTLLPARLVTTNTYVNPVIAVFLGWLLLGETVSVRALAAMVLVLVSVAGILGRQKPASNQKVPEELRGFVPKAAAADAATRKAASPEIPLRTPASLE